MDLEPVITVKLSAHELRLIRYALSVASYDPEELVSIKKQLEEKVKAWMKKALQELSPKYVKELPSQRDDYGANLLRRRGAFLALNVKLQMELWRQYGSKLLLEAQLRHHPCEGCPEFDLCDYKDKEYREEVCHRCPACFHDLGEARSDASASCDWCGWF